MKKWKIASSYKNPGLDLYVFIAEHYILSRHCLIMLTTTKQQKLAVSKNKKSNLEKLIG